jgi:hypothetical protein
VSQRRRKALHIPGGLFCVQPRPASGVRIKPSRCNKKSVRSRAPAFP